MSRICMKTVLFVICFMLLPLIAMAEPTYDKYGDLIRPEAENFSGTLEDFSLTQEGVISGIVINDTRYTVDDKTFYRNESGDKSRLSRFQKSTSVDYYAIGSLITNLSVSTSHEESGEPTNSRKDHSPPAEVQKDIHQEDGVWKN